MKKLYIESDGELSPNVVKGIFSSFDALKVVKPSKRRFKKGENNVRKKD